MPPKPKFTREEVVSAALDFVREKGADALTSRGLGEYLGCSSCPIFTLFADMDDLKKEVGKKAKALFDSYMEVAEEYTPAYKKRGMQWVKFASEEKQLFRMLFMERVIPDSDFDHAIRAIPFGKDRDINIIMRDYRASAAQAEFIFSQMWIYTYGLCTLSATGVCEFCEDEVSARLSTVFGGLIASVKSGVKDITPVMADSSDGKAITKQHPDLGRETPENNR